MIELGINIDHVATIREARKTNEPDPVYAACEAEAAGADGITIHLREDRRHIQDRDLRLIRQVVKSKLNLEMALNEEVIQIALDVKPDIVCIVPEKREEVTTEGGLDASGNFNRLKDTVTRLKSKGIACSIFIDPAKEQIDASKSAGAGYIELHTGHYANTWNNLTGTPELTVLKEASEYAYSQGIIVNAGHGLTYQNVGPICRLPYINELNIGHSIIARSVFCGLKQAIGEMRELIRRHERI